MSWNVQGIVEDAQTSSSRAVQFDREGKLEISAYYYREAARFLDTAAGFSESNREAWHAKAEEYRQRGNQLDEIRKSQTLTVAQSNSKKQLQQCRFLFQQALDADEAGKKDEAVEFYSQAVEFAINAKATTSDTDLQGKLVTLAKQALERAEKLKGISPVTEEAAPETSTSFVPPLPEQRPIVPVRAGSSTGRPQLHRGSSAHLKVSGGQATYTDEEKLVLLKTSHINNKEYVPFMSVDLGERFQYPMPFTDKEGLLALSPKQRRDFAKWSRPDELSDSPVMVMGKHVDCFSIKQTVVSDCSFVASLAVSALYERRFGRRLITTIIYPRNRQKEPMVNPFGKYMVKLHINGIPRKVVIDDLLPVNRHGDLLCSYSTNRSEIWISLLEKAYMKVMGGYDFPGSNSNIDLHALTGWIPERMAIRPNDPDWNSDALFETLLTRIKQGDVLATVATGELSDVDAERTGLVPTHAYAVLDVRRVNGVRLLQLKNPWSHLRWRGNYSELDVKHWTAEMRRALDFDPSSAAMFDNGVFWIDYDSICKFYDVFYLNWNPVLFNFTYCIHQSWQAGVGPVKDAYNIGENPQFSLEITPGAGAVWILLTRHITQLDDFKENKEYITVLVYKNEGKKVFYPNDPPPFLDGVRINSPHYLVKIILKEESTRKYTLVISQYEKMKTIFYTLRAYATCPFTLKKITNPYQHTKQVSDGQWKGVTAGGCGNHPATHPNNPRYQITLESSSNSNQLLIDLRGPKQYQVGVDVVCVIVSDPSAPGVFKKKHSGAFRSGFVVLTLDDVPAGTYDIIPATFLPNQESPFFLTVKSSCPFKLNRIQ